MSRHLPALKPRAVLRALTKAGFFIHHVSGSHYILKHREDAAELRLGFVFGYFFFRWGVEGVAGCAVVVAYCEVAAGIVSQEAHYCFFEVAGHGVGGAFFVAFSVIFLCFAHLSFRKPRSRNQSMKRSCQVPKGMPPRSVRPPDILSPGWRPLP